MTAGEIVPGVSRRFWAGPRNGEHMPFPGHRTVAEVWEDQARIEIRRGLGKLGPRHLGAWRG